LNYLDDLNGVNCGEARETGDESGGNGHMEDGGDRTSDADDEKDGGDRPNGAGDEEDSDDWSLPLAGRRDYRSAREGKKEGPEGQPAAQ
jgi:hypothetical protein